MKISVIIPIYNEITVIKQTTTRLHEFLLRTYGEGNFELLLVDDGSTDGTLSIVEELVGCLPGLFVTGYTVNQGKGAAVRYGMLKAQGDFVLFTDCDLAYGISVIQDFTNIFDQGKVDVIIGSRCLSKDGYGRYSLFRKVMSIIYTRIIHLYTALPYTDSQCGIKGFSNAIAKEIFSKCKTNDWAFDLEVLFFCKQKSLRVKELPVVVLNHQKSKIRPVFDAIRMLITAKRIKSKFKNNRYFSMEKCSSNNIE